jgi:hypothetical protein
VGRKPFLLVTDSVNYYAVQCEADPLLEKHTWLYHRSINQKRLTAPALFNWVYVTESLGIIPWIPLSLMYLPQVVTHTRGPYHVKQIVVMHFIIHKQVVQSVCASILVSACWTLHVQQHSFIYFWFLQLVSTNFLTNRQITTWTRVLEKLRVRSVSQEIPPLLWNPNVHYRVHKSLPPVIIMSQTNPILIPKPYFPKIHFNIILPYMPRSSEWSLSCTLSNQNSVRISPMRHPSLQRSTGNAVHRNFLCLLGESYETQKYKYRQSATLCSPPITTLKWRWR